MFCAGGNSGEKLKKSCPNENLTFAAMILLYFLCDVDEQGSKHLLDCSKLSHDQNQFAMQFLCIKKKTSAVEGQCYGIVTLISTQEGCLMLENFIFC